MLTQQPHTHTVQCDNLQQTIPMHNPSILLNTSTVTLMYIGSHSNTCGWDCP